MEQTWSNVLFLHLDCSATHLQKHVPFKLDLYQGRGVLSVVPFHMKKIRFPYLPSIPYLSSLWELNLRAYVEVNGVKGVYFFTLDTDSILATIIARSLFKLPYRLSSIEATFADNKYSVLHRHKNENLRLRAQVSAESLISDFDLWSTERYSLFTKRNQSVYEGKVIHSPWSLKKAELLDLDDHFSTLSGVEADMKTLSLSYSEELKVRFTSYQRIHHVD